METGDAQPTGWDAQAARLEALEASLRERELELVEAQRINKIGTWRHDVVTGAVEWSREVHLAFGSDPDGPALRPPLLDTLFLEGGDARMCVAFERCRRTGEPYEVDSEVEGLDGQRRWICARGEVSRWGEGGQVLQMRGTVQDVTERKRTEIALRERERELAEAHRIGRLGSFRWLKKDGSVLWSEEVFRAFGVDPGSPVPRGDDVARLMTPESWERIAKATYDALETGAPYCMDLELVDRNGAGRRWVTVRGEGLRGADGEITELAGTVQDVTERRRVEEALRDSQAQFRELAESLPQLVWTSDATGDRVYTNRRYTEYTGVPAEELRGGLWRKLLHPEDLARTNRLWAHSMATGEPYLNEYRIRRYDGEYRSFLVRGVALRNEAGEIERWLGSATDIHDQKLAEEALRRTEKLAAAGRLAATIAHEINNPLAAVTNALYLALMDEGLSAATRSYLTMAEQELARAAHVTAQTLQFHRQNSTPAEADLGEVMESAVALFGTRFRSSGIVVEREYEARTRLHCCGDELRQVFANLLSNALDAMRQGGRLRVRVREGRSWDEGGKAGLRVTVADTGSGIPAEVRARVFEPFLSTKEATGTGLGLWVSENIVRKHQGRIRLRSQMGRGTVFGVFLPGDGMER